MSDARLFISYSHKDKHWLQLLQTQFAILSKQGQVTAWSDEHIRPGDSWNAEIQEAMLGADVAILLVTDNFLASRFIMDVELPTLIDLLDGRRTGRLRRVMPLIVEPCLWKLVPALKAMEVRPKGRELAEGNEYQRKRDLADFAMEVAKILFETPAPEPARDDHEKDDQGAVVLTDKSYATLEIRLSHCEWSHYKSELSFTWSGDRKWDFVHRYPVNLDLETLAGLEEVAAYASALARSLFPDEPAREKLELAKARAEEKRVPLRVRVCIEPSARELHTVNWESLTIGGGAERLFSPGATCFARYTLALGADLHPVQVRCRSEPEALVLGLAARASAAVSMPGPEHLDAIAAALSDAGIAARVERRWLLLEELEPLLRRHDGIDLVFLCMLGCGEPAKQEAYCGHSPDAADVAGTARRIIAGAFNTLERLPRLVAIDNAAIAEADASACWPCFVYLAHELTEQGVLGALTLQGHLAAEDWTRFLTGFFREIKDHGQMDRAAMVARERVRDSGAPWAPAIVSRLRSSKLWYLPRFMDERIRDATWSILLKKIEQGRCLPIVGAGVDYRVARFRQEVAMRWADKYQYPLSVHEQASLSQVAQYVAATFGRDHLMEELNDQLRGDALQRYGRLLSAEERSLPLDRLISAIAGRSKEAEPTDPHFTLASLPFRMYVTATFNSFLADALRGQGRNPEERIFNGIDDGELGVGPEVERPLVYHLFGRLDDEQSLVLTEDDYFDFLIDYWNDRERIPKALRGALAGYTLLFLGFNLNHWDFRVLFRSLLKEEGRGRRSQTTHVAVQIVPDDDQITDPDRAREYLEKYFEKFSDGNVSIYWGSSEDFLTELWRRWQEVHP